MLRGAPGAREAVHGGAAVPIPQVLPRGAVPDLRPGGGAVRERHGAGRRAEPVPRGGGRDGDDAAAPEPRGHRRRLLGPAEEERRLGEDRHPGHVGRVPDAAPGLVRLVEGDAMGDAQVLRLAPGPGQAPLHRGHRHRLDAGPAVPEATARGRPRPADPRRRGGADSRLRPGLCDDSGRRQRGRPGLRQADKLRRQGRHQPDPGLPADADRQVPLPRPPQPAHRLHLPPRPEPVQRLPEDRRQPEPDRVGREVRLLARDLGPGEHLARALPPRRGRFVVILEEGAAAARREEGRHEADRAARLRGERLDARARRRGARPAHRAAPLRPRLPGLRHQNEGVETRHHPTHAALDLHPEAHHRHGEAHTASRPRAPRRRRLAPDAPARLPKPRRDLRRRARGHDLRRD
mmetsp:Transcript_9651/g.30938  ORF Transcript_9651/g.30938 Transcript_9651/m.30938 type:complete len:405 (+) Transcript_9651:383-1597(+)